MKTLITFLLFLCIHAGSFAQRGIELNTNGQLKVLGHVERDRLNQEPFSEWFIPNYESIETEKKEIKVITKSLQNVDSIQIFFGSWCGDSKRNVPPFLKLLEESGFENFRLIGLDNSFQNYKQSPFREEIGLDIHRVPTFIFYSNDKEIGRIVEYPVTTFSEDIVSLITTDDYVPNYEIVHDVQELLASKGAEYITYHADSLATLLTPKAVKVSELNTLAFKLFTSFQIAESEAVYMLNSKIYPEDYYPFYSMGRFYKRIGNKQLAKLAFTEGLVANPENERLKEQLSSLD